MPHISKHSSHVSTKEIPLPTSSSKPIQIVRSSKHKVVLVLPAQTHPPIVSSSPSHRTAPNPQPVLISSSYPGRHHHHPHSPSSSLPSSSHMRSGSNHFLHVPASGSGMPSRSPPGGNNAYLNTTPISRSASHDSYYSRSRSTITPVMKKRTSDTSTSTLEDEYYSHPAVRAYEMQKAAEQARWARHRMMQREQQQQQQQQRGRDPYPKTVYYDSSRSTITPTQQRW